MKVIVTHSFIFCQVGYFWIANYPKLIWLSVKLFIKIKIFKKWSICNQKKFCFVIVVVLYPYVKLKKKKQFKTECFACYILKSLHTCEYSTSKTEKLLKAFE
jgi:hypothetical protein